MKTVRTSLYTPYSQLMIVMHWCIAILIIMTYTFINLKGLFEKGSDPRELMKALHFMLGLSVLLLMGLRIYAKLTGYTPAISPPLPAWQRIFSKSIHGVLYLFMISMPILGWLTLSAAGKPIPFFGLSLPALMHENVDNAKSLKSLHKTIGSLGYYLIVLHIGAGLYHHLIKKDDTLKRILPASH
jgi:cytochrome b561